MRGGLFSDGRSDVHADLMPRNDGVIGIWKIGMTASVGGSGVLDYGSADLTFRYDQSKVNVGEPIALYRWNGSRWERVAEKIADMPLHNYYETAAFELEAGGSRYATLIVRMPESVDNIANYRGTNQPKVELGITVKADQIEN